MDIAANGKTATIDAKNTLNMIILLVVLKVEPLGMFSGGVPLIHGGDN
jgi:hypothetical protein